MATVSQPRLLGLSVFSPGFYVLDMDFHYSARSESKGTGEMRSSRAEKQPPPASSAHN